MLSKQPQQIYSYFQICIDSYSHLSQENYQESSWLDQQWFPKCYGNSANHCCKSLLAAKRPWFYSWEWNPAAFVQPAEYSCNLLNSWTDWKLLFWCDHLFSWQFPSVEWENNQFKIENRNITRKYFSNNHWLYHYYMWKINISFEIIHKFVYIIIEETLVQNNLFSCYT